MNKGAKASSIDTVDFESEPDLQKHYGPIAIKAVAAALMIKATSGSGDEIAPTRPPIGVRSHLESD